MFRNSNVQKTVHLGLRVQNRSFVHQRGSLRLYTPRRGGGQVRPPRDAPVVAPVAEVMLQLAVPLRGFDRTQP